MSEPFLGQIMAVGFNFAPRGWALCNGALLAISSNTALFSLLGTTYGGNGQTTFGLPDLRGRVAVGQGQGPGLSPYVMGEMIGNENVTLLTSQMPQHNHIINADASPGTTASPSGSNIAQVNTGTGKTPALTNSYTPAPPTASASLNPSTVQAQGGGQPHSNLQPLLCVNYIIALQGIFPSRN